MKNDLESRRISWRRIRQQFALDPDQTYLAAMLFASHPRPVRDAIEFYRRKLDGNPKIAHDDLNENDIRVLRAAASYFDVGADQIALMDSTTMGLGLIYTSMKLSPGDEILQSEHAHYSVDESLRYAKDRYRACPKKIALYNPTAPGTATEAGIVERLVAGVTEATRLVAVTWVHSSTGVKLPLRRISNAIRDINSSRTKDRQIFLAVDGVHALGIENFVLSESLCDYFIAGCHKTLCGPRGTGIVWASKRGWEYVRPTIPSFGQEIFEAWRKSPDADPTEVAIGRRMTPGGYHSAEHRWALAEGFAFQLQIGKRRIERRLHRLAQFFKRKLADMPHVQLLTPIDQCLSSAMICFNVDGWKPTELEAYLEQNGVIASSSPYRLPCLRVSPGLYTTFKDLRIALRVISRLQGFASMGPPLNHDSD